MNEPVVLHHLADAMDALMHAEESTSSGFLSDFCDNALIEVRKAIGCMGEPT